VAEGELAIGIGGVAAGSRSPHASGFCLVFFLHGGQQTVSFRSWSQGKNTDKFKIYTNFNFKFKFQFYTCSWAGPRGIASRGTFLQKQKYITKRSLPLWETVMRGWRQGYRTDFFQK
jgi:hypothetical protein